MKQRLQLLTIIVVSLILIVIGVSYVFLREREPEKAEHESGTSEVALGWMTYTGKGAELVNKNETAGS